MVAAVRGKCGGTVVVTAVIIDCSFVVGEGGREGWGDQEDQSSLNLTMKSSISLSWCK